MYFHYNYIHLGCEKNTSQWKVSFIQSVLYQRVHFCILSVRWLPASLYIQVLLQQARDKAVEFDTSYQTLKAQLQQRDQTLRQQEPIHSEVEVVKRQLEENKV